MSAVRRAIDCAWPDCRRLCLHQVQALRKVGVGYGAGRELDRTARLQPRVVVPRGASGYQRHLNGILASSHTLRLTLVGG